MPKDASNTGTSGVRTHNLQITSSAPQRTAMQAFMAYSYQLVVLWSFHDHFLVVSFFNIWSNTKGLYESSYT